MAPRFASISYFLLLAVPFLAPTISTQSLDTCFIRNGAKTFNSGYRCNNATTGHSACCGEGSTCYSNGLCQQNTGSVVDYLRVGCTDRTWQDPSCFKRCASIQNYTTAGVRFCNTTVETSTTYCCDDGSQGVGSFHCCNNRRSIFRLTPAATILANMPLSPLSTPTASSSPIPPTISSAPANDSPSAGGRLNTAVIIGAVMGISGALIILGLIGFSLWRRKQDVKQNQPFRLQDNEGTGGPVYHQDNISLKSFEAGVSPITPQDYSGARNYPTSQAVPLRNKAYELGV